MCRRSSAKIAIMVFNGLKYYSFGHSIGYGTAALAYLEHLYQKEKKISWNPILLGEKTQAGITDEFISTIPDQLREVLFSTAIDNTYSHKIIHTTPEHFPAIINTKKENIGMTVWETDRLPTEWLKPLSVLDKIIVPCKWNKEVFANAGIKQPIYVLPHISQFKGVPVELSSNIPEDAFVFLNVSVWEKRKNMEQLLEVFFKAFPHQKNVLLVLKTSDKDIGKHFLRIWKYSYFINTSHKVSVLKLKHKAYTAKVMVIQEKVSTQYMQYLYSRANAYVSLTHAEGWGMGVFESAWYGKPVITTNYSGYLDFLSPENSFLIDCKPGPVIQNHWDYKRLESHCWAMPDTDHAISLMQSVYNNYTNALEKARLLKQNIENNFSAEVITDKFLDIINE